MDEPAKTSETDDRLVRRAAFWFALVVAVLTVGFHVLWLVVIRPTAFEYSGDVLKNHYAGIIGLPASAVVSFIVVVFLRQTEGPIEIEGSGFKLIKGATGPVILWAFSFFRHRLGNQKKFGPQANAQGGPHRTSEFFNG
jgi:hypothetical protein